VIAIPQSEAFKWENPGAWQGNPVSAPPVWVNYFGEDAPTTVGVSSDGLDLSRSPAASTPTPSTTSVGLGPRRHTERLLGRPRCSTGRPTRSLITWTKPDGSIDTRSS
jgi:hypothetical protein